MSSDNGTSFRLSDCQYVYNLRAKSLSARSYKVQVTISGSVVGSGLVRTAIAVRFVGKCVST